MSAALDTQCRQVAGCSADVLLPLSPLLRSYFFMASFIDEHVAFHAKHLKA
jgi:hypothetical protein